MNKKIKPTRVKFWYFIVPKSIKSLTLAELLISIIIIAIMIVGILGFEIFSNAQVIDSDRRIKVQNQLAYCLEHMSKYIQQANGSIVFPAIELLAGSDGFRVQIDFNTPQTPSNLADDAWVSYSLSGNTLSTSCSSVGCGSFVADTLSNKIIANFNNSIMPVNPTDGFYVFINSSGNLVDIGLVGRSDPTRPVIDPGAPRFVNPQVEAKTKIICNSSSSN